MELARHLEEEGDGAVDAIEVSRGGLLENFRKNSAMGCLTDILILLGGGARNVY